MTAEGGGGGIQGIRLQKSAGLFQYILGWGRFTLCTLIKKKIKFSSYIRKFRMEQLHSHMWLTASSYMGKNLRISSYIRKPFLIYDFATASLWISLYMRKILFYFYQCMVLFTWGRSAPVSWPSPLSCLRSSRSLWWRRQGSPGWYPPPAPWTLWWRP